eukprot:10669887-Prorocentrum_lima.AAC.1
MMTEPSCCGPFSGTILLNTWRRFIPIHLGVSVEEPFDLLDLVVEELHYLPVLLEELDENQ